MNLKINLMSKPQITFSKCLIGDVIFMLLTGICILHTQRHISIHNSSLIVIQGVSSLNAYIDINTIN